MKRPLFVANWKMNHTIGETIAYLTVLLHEAKAVGNTDVVLAPPFTALSSLGIALSENNSEFQLAGQNLCWEDSGAFTGEISGAFLAEVGCRYVIIGHSERRKIFGETDAMIGKKIEASIRHHLTPILCVGETLPEREAGKAWDTVENQLRGALREIPLAKLKGFVVAYEPVWAIGTGKNATPAEAKDMHGLIHQWIASVHGGEVADITRLLYGGSVTPGNSRELLRQPHIDGALVGGASLDARKFTEIIRSVP
ncbi:MAG: triose-phosphate isomerase [Deltaproteobacteria bacterium]|nr:triose-phosphate isomerase [Deltaproteobacteria bacterium]